MSQPEDNFESLQKLLVCKRYEQPPPGYFLSFSDKVLARIEAEEASEYSSWWSWLVARFDAKPVLVCAYGVAVSSLLFMGFRLSQVFETEMAVAPAPSGPWLAVSTGSPILLPGDLGQGAYPELVASSVLGSKFAFRDESSHLFFPRITPVAQPAGFHFGQ